MTNREAYPVRTNDGVSVATNIIIRWLENEPELLEKARRSLDDGDSLVRWASYNVYEWGYASRLSTIQALQEADGGLDAVDWMFVRRTIVET